MSGLCARRRLIFFVSIVIAPLLALFRSAPAHAEEAAWSRARVAELARAAPASRVASSEVAVARAAVGAAGALSLDNPVLSGMGGVRLNADGSRLFSGTASLSWPVDLGGQRGARIDAAKAEQRGATAAAEEAQRQIVLAALLQHALTLRDERLVALAAERRALAERLSAAASRRRTAGSAAELEVTLAALQVRRDAALETAAKGARDADKIALVALLGLAPLDPQVAGALVPPGDPPPLSTLLREVENRVDVRRAAAALEAARARSSREQASRFPTISVLAQYERDDRANIGLLGLAVPIPVLNANRAGVATSAAEVDVARARAEAVRAAADGNIRQLYARYAATKKALLDLAPAADLADQAVSTAARGYELGENDLASVLTVRREANDARAALLEAELAHANAKIELLVTAGRIPQ